ncbi:MAG: universal stress protein [Propionicimonas sp.]|uniref:universal stress protein n=1 Tax=Propionicimonas sp. TaxID=1955623 RepID=UPI002B1F228D|nr:universal stress protein [Propionicimonas sp.]MEA4943680.1 universal stress protein [Propionicimonas sp.]MEA5054841.1 universal stress protein [Propionicimonas sp.]MEA5118387.1 universal stress protein [Propionicimonas sp.]
MLRSYDGPTRVLAGYDDSPDAQRALAYAVAVAKARDAELVLLNAVDDTVLNSAWGVVFDAETIKTAATELLLTGVDEAVARGLPRDRIRTAVELGNPAAALARHSEEASLIVVGRRSESEGERAYVGSTAVGVVGTSACPVVVVSATERLHTRPTGLMGVGVNTAARGRVALEWTLRQGERLGGEVAVISVAKAAVSRLFRGSADSPQTRAEIVEVTRERITDMIQPIAAEHPDVPVELEVHYGVPLDILVARSAQLDLLVLEVQAAFPTYAVGGLTRGLLTHAHCPVVTLRGRDSHDS